MNHQRLIAIGDVHGCLAELSTLLEKLNLQPQDQLVFLGDLVNKGPNSAGVIDRVRQLPNTRFLIGNHERRLLKYHKKKDPAILKTVDYPTIAQLRPRHWKFLKKRLQRYYYEPKYDTVFVHAGFLPDSPWQEQPLKVITRIQVINKKGKAKMAGECPKGIRWNDCWQGPPFVVYGHTPTSRVSRRPWSIGIDTDCAGGGALSAYLLPNKTIVQVPASQRYY